MFTVSFQCHTGAALSFLGFYLVPCKSFVDWQFMQKSILQFLYWVLHDGSYNIVSLASCHDLGMICLIHVFFRQCMKAYLLTCRLQRFSWANWNKSTHLPHSLWVYLCVVYFFVDVSLCTNLRPIYQVQFFKWSSFIGSRIVSSSSIFKGWSYFN